MDTVNMPYHHGALREALVDAACALARNDGPEAVVLRAVSRVAGVSHNAAYRHFADRDELLREVCTRCMTQLATRMESEIATALEPATARQHAWSRLAATGRAYVEFALAEPGWFRTAFAFPKNLVALRPGEGAGPAGRNPYEILTAALDELLERGHLPPARRPGAEHAAWSAVHGLSVLLVDGPLREVDAAERERALQAVLDVVAAGLSGSPPS